jgi:hypothetical protein
MTGANLLLALLVGASPLAAQAPGVTRIVGRVLDQGNRKPVKAALVTLSLPGSGVVATAETDGNGRFVFGEIAADVHFIKVERLGYRPREDSVRAVAAQTAEVTVPLGSKPVELAPIAVTVRSRWLALNGFYERRDLDGIKAHIIDRAMIERRMPPMITDLLVEAPGVEVVFVEVGRRTVRFNRHVPMPPEAGKGQRSALDPRRTGPDEKGCEPDLYIDGQLHRNTSTGLSKVDDFNVISPIAIEAIEVYAGNTPLQFHHNCGVILIWTKRGG